MHKTAQNYFVFFNRFVKTNSIQNVAKVTQILSSWNLCKMTLENRSGCYKLALAKTFGDAFDNNDSINVDF
jgi:hypothetical protein